MIHWFTARSFSLALLLAGAVAASEPFPWEEGARSVEGFPFTAAFIDSLRTLYDVPVPEVPLRRIAGNGFRNGEELVYEVTWGPFMAGHIILSATPDSAKRTIRLGGKVLSSGLVKRFFRVRDYVISTVDAEGLYPIFFEQHIREGKKYTLDAWTLFDHPRGSLTVQTKKLKSYAAPRCVNDFISVLYNVRARRFSPGDTFSLPLFIDDKVHSMMFTCPRREILRLNDVDITCLLIEPRLVGDKGVLTKKDQLSVWVSDDEYKTPIRIRSKVKVGSVTASLIYRRHADEGASSMVVDKSSAKIYESSPSAP